MTTAIATLTRWIVCLRHAPFAPELRRQVVEADSELTAWQQAREVLTRATPEPGVRTPGTQQAMRDWLLAHPPEQLPEGAKIVQLESYQRELTDITRREQRERAELLDADKRHKRTLEELLGRLVEAEVQRRLEGNNGSTS